MYSMKWVRLLFAYLFCLILFISLINVAFSTSEHAALTNQPKIENWISQSGFYANLQKTITDQARNAISNDLTGGSTISSSVINDAAQSAFPQSALQQAVHEFISSNYSWLEGKSGIPDFKIDLSTSKVAFADEIAQTAIVNHLKNLPTCTATSQSAQLLAANPLLLSCKPANINPETEAAQVGIQIANSNGYISSPVITASTISAKGSNGGELYYVKFSKAPKIYQTVNKLPLILSVVSLLSMIIIFFVSRTRRIGMKRIGIVLLLSGLLLVADKFVSDALFNRYKDQAFSGLNNGLLQHSLINFVHYIETELVKIDLWFGVGYLVVAVLILGTIFFTRNKQTTNKETKNPTPSKPAQDNPDNRSMQSNGVGTPQNDYEMQPVNPIRSPHVPKSNYKPTKQRKPPRPPKLIQ